MNTLCLAGRAFPFAAVYFLSFAIGSISTGAADSISTTANPNLIGTVSNLTGVPVTNASIFIYTAGPREGAGVVCPSCYADCHKSAQSDSSGKFKINSLSPRLLFRILVVAPGYAPRFFDNVDPFKGPLDAKLDLRSTITVPRQQSIIGRVVNTTNEPLVNAVVSVEGTTIGNTTYGSPPKGTDPLAITDERGEFSIQSTTNFDAMNLRVEARGYARRSYLQIRPGLKPKDFVLSEGAALTGQVLFHGQPLTNVSVGVAGVDRSMGNFIGDFIIGTDENGRFLFVNLPSDRDYTIYGLMNSLKTFGALPVQAIHTGKDGSVTDVGTLKVMPGHRLAGQVKLSDNRPIPGHTHLFISRQTAWDTSVDIELPADGRFDFNNVPAETISLTTRVKDYRFSERNVSLDRLNPFGLVGRLDADKTNLMVLLEPGHNLAPDYSDTPDEERPEKLPLGGAETKRVVPNAVTISGQARDVETKKPILRFRVIPGIQRYPHNQWIEWLPSKTSESSDGNFSLTLSSKSGSIVLTAEADGYLPVQSDALEAGQTNWNFQLQKGVGPGGTVRRPDGRPATNAMVMYLAGQQQGYLDGHGRLAAISYNGGGQQKLTDDQGHFSFIPKLGSGGIFAASSDGFARMPVESLQERGELQLQPWARVHGRLVKQGKPVAGENVDLSVPFVLGQAILNLHGTVTDDEGRFTIDFVPPGDMGISTRTYSGSNRSGWSNQSQRGFAARPGEDVDLGDVVKIDSER